MANILKKYAQTDVGTRGGYKAPASIKDVLINSAAKKAVANSPTYKQPMPVIKKPTAVAPTGYDPRGGKGIALPVKPKVTAPTSMGYDPRGGKGLGGYAPSVTTPTPTTPTYSAPTSTLKRGAKGDDVKWLQQFLGIDVDGSFGGATDAAVRAWQKANGLDPDGSVGRLTRAAMQGINVGNIPTSSSGSSSSGSSSSGGGSKAPSVPNIPSTPGVSQPAPQAPTSPSFSFNEAMPEFNFDGSMPDFNFNYEAKPVQSMDELIAQAAQQLNPQYDMVRGDANKRQEQNMIDIQNQMIKKGRAMSTYAGNVQADAMNDHNDLLTNIGLQQQAHATDIGRDDYDKAMQLERDNYSRSYQEAIDAYNMAMQGYSSDYSQAMDSYQRDIGAYESKYGQASDEYSRAIRDQEFGYQQSQDAWQRTMAEQELAMQKQMNQWQMSQPRYSSSGGSNGSGGSSRSSSGNSGSTTNRAKAVQNFTANSIESANAVVSAVRSGSRPLQGGIKALEEEMNAIKSGYYGDMTRAERQEAIDYIFKQTEALRGSLRR